MSLEAKAKTLAELQEWFDNLETGIHGEDSHIYEALEQKWVLLADAQQEIEQHKKDNKYLTEIIKNIEQLNTDKINIIITLEKQVEAAKTKWDNAKDSFPIICRYDEFDFLQLKKWFTATFLVEILQEKKVTLGETT